MDQCSHVFARACPTRRRGACAAFVDPNLTAQQASPIWLPEAVGAPFRVSGARIDPASNTSVGLLVTTLANVEHILFDAVGRLHLLLRASQGRLQLTITGCETLISPYSFSLPLRNLLEIAINTRHLSKLNTLLCSPPRSANAAARWTAHTKRLRDALIAFDGRNAGATFREIAVVIYGRERVDRDWPGAGLKVRARRDFRRGLALCSGGYRNLLNEG